MARITEEVTHVFYNCEQCPYFTRLYQDDGFGMREVVYAGKCDQGYFKEEKKFDMLQCIPPYCKFSDKKKTGKESLEDLTDLTERELLRLFRYIKQDQE